MASEAGSEPRKNLRISRGRPPVQRDRLDGWTESDGLARPTLEHRDYPVDVVEQAFKRYVHAARLCKPIQDQLRLLKKHFAGDVDLVDDANERPDNVSDREREQIRSFWDRLDKRSRFAAEQITPPGMPPRFCRDYLVLAVTGGISPYAESPIGEPVEVWVNTSGKVKQVSLLPGEIVVKMTDAAVVTRHAFDKIIDDAQKVAGHDQARPKGGRPPDDERATKVAILKATTDFTAQEILEKVGIEFKHGDDARKKARYWEKKGCLILLERLGPNWVQLVRENNASGGGAINP
jgi:hypothetical protein